MFGYSKDLFDDENTFLDNVKAICAVRDKYNFRKVTGLVCVLEGFQSTVMLFYGQTSRIIIHFRIDTEIDPEYSDEIALKLMRLNNTHGLNLSLNDSKRIGCDHTVFSTPHPVSPQCFLEVYETFMSKIDAVRDELIALAGKYARSFLDQEVEDTAIEVQDDFKDELKKHLKDRIEKHLESAMKKIAQEQDFEDNSDDDSDDDIVVPDDDDIFSLFNDSKSFNEDEDE